MQGKKISHTLYNYLTISVLVHASMCYTTKSNWARSKKWSTNENRIKSHRNILPQIGKSSCHKVYGINTAKDSRHKTPTMWCVPSKSSGSLASWTLSVTSAWVSSSSQNDRVPASPTEANSLTVYGSHLRSWIGCDVFVLVRTVYVYVLHNTTLHSR